MNGPALQPRSLAAGLARAGVAVTTQLLMLSGAYPLLPAAFWARARRRRLIGELARLRVGREWLRGVAICAARPLSLRPLPGRRRGPRPVILVHGYGMGRSSFTWLARRLARSGLGPVVGFEYWSLGSLASAAAELDRVVTATAAAAGTDRVDIVGHSMGGLVGRYYVALGPGASRVRKLITLGTPHAGSRLTPFGLGRARLELAVDSATLTRLARAPIPEAVEATVVWSPDDILAGSRRHTEVAGAEVLELQGVNHLEMLTGRRVADAVVKRLWAPLGR